MVTSAYRRGSGEPVLLLHGFTLSHHGWHRVVDDLAADYDVLALTMPGHWGASSRITLVCGPPPSSAQT